MSTLIEDLEQAGFYVASGVRFSVLVPAQWMLQETEEDLQVSSPSGKTAVIVSTFKRTGPEAIADAREHLSRFLAKENVKAEATLLIQTQGDATADYNDSEGGFWRVTFLMNARRLVLATCNSTRGAEAEEVSQGRHVLASINLEPHFPH